MLDNELRSTQSIIIETNDYNNHVFSLVQKDEQSYLRYEQSEIFINLLVIKPNIKIFFEDGNYEDGKNFFPSYLSNKVLVTNIFIDPDIFLKLIADRMISYSKAMADLYSLPVDYSFDIRYHRQDYKRSKNKEKVLTKLKTGHFN